MTQQLDFCPLLRMSAQIPAWQPSLVRKHSVDASLRLWRIETELCLSVLLQHGIVVIHRHRAVNIASARRPHPENGIVQNIGQNDYPNRNTDHGDQDSSQAHSKAWGRYLGHDARLSPCLAKRALLLQSLQSLRQSLLSQSRQSLLTLTTPPSGRQTTAFAGNRFWRGSAAVQGRFPAQVL
jgi:hypothetical protein